MVVTGKSGGLGDNELESFPTISVAISYVDRVYILSDAVSVEVREY